MANMAAQYSTSRMFAFGWPAVGVSPLTHCFSVIAKNVTINYMSPKLHCQSIVSATFLLQTVCVHLLPL